ncbi:hypothetical protein D7M11_14545 [Paenibacillus ginsengarvi]|uniref:Uncharacterized protein n=2 Tax=Paenibacillus ginsengarvi TaxID=400777 RepID=A0A3B0CG92_9BACL|nr:hypothetical protein D7M11_14545 [Paenibacillus ginsengarvi]
MNEQIKRVAAERAAAQEFAVRRDWSEDIERLETRLRELRKAAMTGPSPGGSGKRSDEPAATPSTGRSMLESLAYAQTVQIRQERPKRAGRKSWRPEVFEPTLGDDPLPDSGLMPKPYRGKA